MPLTANSISPCKEQGSGGADSAWLSNPGSETEWMSSARTVLGKSREAALSCLSLSSPLSVHFCLHNGGGLATYQPLVKEGGSSPRSPASEPLTPWVTLPRSPSHEVSVQSTGAGGAGGAMMNNGP